MDRSDAERGSHRTDDESDDLPNLLTIVGRGVPGNFEVTVDGDLTPDADSPDGHVVSGSAAEGSIDVGVVRYRFSGQMTNVRVTDWNGTDASASASTPTVHVEYGAGK